MAIFEAERNKVVYEKKKKKGGLLVEVDAAACAGQHGHMGISRQSLTDRGTVH